MIVGEIVNVWWWFRDIEGLGLGDVDYLVGSIRVNGFFYSSTMSGFFIFILIGEISFFSFSVIGVYFYSVIFKAEGLFLT